MPRSGVSILIVTWNSASTIKACLRAATAEIQKTAGEVIVVDNASTDETRECIRRGFPDVRLIANSENLGFAKANNQAAKVAQNPYLLVLNPDTELKPGAVAAMREVLERDLRVAVVGPHLRYPDLTHQPSVRRFPTLLSHSLLLLKLSQVFPNLPVMRRYYARDFNYEQEATVDQVMGAAMMIRASVFSRLGGFDEAYWIWMEEVDFQKRVRDQGLRVMYVPNAEVVHHLGVSFSQTALMSRARRFARSSTVYFFKHNGWFAGCVIWGFAQLHLVLTFLYSKLHARNSHTA